MGIVIPAPMATGLKLFASVLLAFWLWVCPAFGDSIWSNPPCELAYEVGAAFGLNNPAHYRIIPQFLTMRWQEFHTMHAGWVEIRHQFLFGIAANAFVHGNEHVYAGMGPGFRFNFGSATSPFELFTDMRCYVGYTDHKGPPNGLGQDFTFSPVGAVGLAYKVSTHIRVSLAFLYEHYSNGNLSEPEVPNIGVDTMGPKIDVSYAF